MVAIREIISRQYIREVESKVLAQSSPVTLDAHDFMVFLVRKSSRPIKMDDTVLVFVAESVYAIYLGYLSRLIAIRCLARRMVATHHRKVYMSLAGSVFW